MKYLYTQDSAIELAEHSLGGKAANLLWLTQNGFPVPDYWVISSEVLNSLLINDTFAINIVEQLAAVPHDISQEKLDAIAAPLRQWLQSIPLPTELEEELALLSENYPDAFFAVRSSAIGEDAANASFAGQMDSYLFQRGKSALADSLRAVMASAFNTRALQYRLHKQLPMGNIRSAVIIQNMVAGEVSGVMFTAHPVTGSRQHCLISSAWGTGEGVVSGECDTDEFSVHLTTPEIERHITQKGTASVFDTTSGSGTVTMPVAEEKQWKPTLPDSKIYALRDIGKKIAAARGCPQDIEWTIQNHQIFILQTRPITRLPRLNDKSERHIIFDNSNIQESYCGITTPLTFSFARAGYATVYEQTIRALGCSDKQVNQHRSMLENMLGLTKGRIYYNINNWYKGLLLLPSFQTNKKDMERMMGLEDPVDFIEDKTPSLSDKIKKLPQMGWALLRLLYAFRTMDQRVELFLEQFKQHAAAIRRTELHICNSSQLIEKLKYLDEHLLQRWTTPILNDFYVMMFNGRVHRGLTAAGIENSSALLGDLLSGDEDIESTQPTKVLLKMCQYARQNSALCTLLTHGDVRTLLTQVRKLDASFHQQCIDYIEKYGDRTMGELKLETITLKQDPSFLFLIIKNYLAIDTLTPETLSSRERKLRTQAENTAFQQIREQLGSKRMEAFKKNLRKLRQAIRHRENMRFTRTRMFGLYRDIFIQLGQAYALEGLLAEPRDIFYLTLEEIYSGYEGTAVQTQLKPLVAIRKQEYASYETEDEPAHHFFIRGSLYQQQDYSYPYQEQQAPTDSGMLQGIGCYPGVVETTIRLIKNPQDEMSLAGQILCTVRTDPGWAPLFPTAGGLLIERGSTLSHSAVVARELGIPAIVGIPAITQILKDGDRVRMDGATGSVIRLHDTTTEELPSRSEHV
ncbi:phosphoenolpyruvate synthase [Photorhabdus khanii]|uniref:Phosphoenolpyruvate synthase n=1 Tax=Photorhabdus khanii subsp. guanajuatensis TaxID=2100166 RepID=A0A4R4K262_9GAMM|nr:phosphoenolpyruvate synthase [Photorhabdus khanii]TDB61293.1 phosphoenolpyruvate synthase [Photorhabdus khanii subsp. guanajuatensis]